MMSPPQLAANTRSPVAEIANIQALESQKNIYVRPTNPVVRCVRLVKIQGLAEHLSVHVYSFLFQIARGTALLN
jgi:hypothetical protein